MSNPYQNCTEVTKACPAEATVYGYYPSLAANSAFVAIFGFFFVVQLIQGLRYKTWTFMIAMTLGCLGEAIGYIGRIMMHSNPWNSNGFEVQICCLILSPAFISAAIYLTLKHLVIAFGSNFSLLQPRLYTWLFISCDLVSLILQGAGGGTAATAKTLSKQQTGNDLMMTGICFQVLTLLVFIILSANYFWAAYHHRTELNPTGDQLRHTLRFKLYLTAICIATTTIFIRCVYRIAEMANGWKNPIMQNQTDFIVLDGVMVTIAVVFLTAFHPGYCFEQMVIQMGGKHSKSDKTFDPEMLPESKPQ